MDFLTDLGKKITETAKTVTKKSGNLVEVTKLTMSISSEEDKIKTMFIEMGGELYKNFLNGESFGEYFDIKCNEIKQSEESINTLKERVLELKGQKACSECSSVADEEVNYCPNCGSKIE